MQSGEAIETGIVGADGLIGGDAAINGHVFGQMTVQLDGAAHKTIRDAADHHDPHVWGRQRCWRNFRICSCEIVKVYKDHGISVIDCYSVA
jgi:hypothetical protein